MPEKVEVEKEKEVDEETVNQMIKLGYNDAEVREKYADND
jgi:hypothetical protein